MIPRIETNWQTHSWQIALAKGIKTPAELLNLLGLPLSLLKNSEEAHRQFPTRVPLSFVQRMKPGDPTDPLLLQVLPNSEEMKNIKDYIVDPVGDLAAQVVPGLLHKYHGRALLVATGACGIHCRYCFRRHFPYTQNNPLTENWRQIYAYLSNDTSIREIILSGGDPLSLSDDKLATLIHQLETIKHLRVLRIHTRLPIVLPQRVSEPLLDILSKTRFITSVVVHVNHANEIDQQVMSALKKIKQSGALLLNQSVLLRGINNNAEVLSDLSYRLLEAGVLPYYLHLLDQVEGSAHFYCTAQSAALILESLRRMLPGYLVPRLVQEIAGNPYKTPR